MKCPTCNEELAMTPPSMLLDKNHQQRDFCFKCMKRFSGKELEWIKESEAIEEDTHTWREFKHSGRQE